MKPFNEYYPLITHPEIWIKPDPKCKKCHGTGAILKGEKRKRWKRKDE
jgi:hypothetical protein